MSSQDSTVVLADAAAGLVSRVLSLGSRVERVVELALERGELERLERYLGTGRV
jgi:hypothetical protein